MPDCTTESTEDTERLTVRSSFIETSEIGSLRSFFLCCFPMDYCVVRTLGRMFCASDDNVGQICSIYHCRFARASTIVVSDWSPMRVSFSKKSLAKFPLSLLMLCLVGAGDLAIVHAE